MIQIFQIVTLGNLFSSLKYILFQAIFMIQKSNLQIDRVVLIFNFIIIQKDLLQQVDHPNMIKCLMNKHNLDVTHVCLKQQCQNFRRYLCSECFHKNLHQHENSEIFKISELGLKIWQLIGPQIEQLKKKKNIQLRIIDDLKELQLVIQRITSIVSEEMTLISDDVKHLDKVIFQTQDDEQKKTLSNENIEEFRAIKYFSQKRLRSRWIDKAVELIQKIKPPMIEFQQQYKEYIEKQNRQVYFSNIPNIKAGYSLNHDAKYLSVGAENKSLQIWDVEKLINKKYDIKFQSEITCSQFSKDSQLLAVGFSDGHLSIFNPNQDFNQIFRSQVTFQKQLNHVCWVSQEFIYVTTQQKLIKFNINTKLEASSQEIANIQTIDYDNKRLYLTYPKENCTQLQIQNEQKKIFTQLFADPICQIHVFRQLVATLDNKHKLQIWYFDEKEFFLNLVQIIREDSNIIKYSYIPQQEHHVIITQ
ncbi:hypothetical protein pb186bvf_002639 [Paramecium bursaria]